MKNLRTLPQDPDRQITLKVNGKKLIAFRGESVFAALHAAGYRSLRKSHRLGEPRGGFCGMGLCHECLVTINGVPDQRACMVEIQDGMEIVIDED